MKNFEFKSQICTTKEQSERLLKLGLKKETADMCWQKTTLNGELITYPAQDVWHCSTAITDYHIPAWSLHRLLCLYGLDYTIKEVYNNAEECYGMLISAIGIAIKDGMFNKDYLEEKNYDNRNKIQHRG